MDTVTEAPQTAGNENDDAQAGADRVADTREAVRAATRVGQGEKGIELTQHAQSLAVEWFLSGEVIPAEKMLDVDIGGGRTIPWKIRSIDAETLKQARKMSELGSRTQRRARAAGGVAAEVDPAENSARIVIAGTIDPDLRALAKQMQEKDGFVDNRPDLDAAALELLRDRFGNKPGIVDMIQNEIVTLSGYDDEAVVEHAAGKA